ncbi:LGFP repeat-containing protein [Cryptosporangium phraense]|uniref:LGFP repeat-containing protein n=1 Tax=Cryptosporangium phraense TaxID=2593070 RepID=UPI001F0D4AA7|nr:hypothetical protein [Cryptosporangium phraense]
MGLLAISPFATAAAEAAEPSSPLCHTGTWETGRTANPWAKETPREVVRTGPRLYRVYEREWISADSGARVIGTRVHRCEGHTQQKAKSVVGFGLNERYMFDGTTLVRTSQVGWREVVGSINDKWASLGYEQGIVGYPTSNETSTPTKTGAFNHFSKNASIYWSPATGAHEVHGLIRDKWASMGWERGDMGFPVTDEIRTPRKTGAFNHFQAGWSIYWSPATGAHEVHGQIRDRWAALGWENSQLGFPTSDEFATTDGGRRTNFQNNCYIQWYPGRGATAYCNSIPRF